MAIIREGLRSENPIAFMNAAVSKYVGDNVPYNQFVEIHMDNPWVRVIITGINELDYKEINLQDISEKAI